MGKVNPKELIIKKNRTIELIKAQLGEDFKKIRNIESLIDQLNEGIEDLIVTIIYAMQEENRLNQYD